VQKVEKIELNANTADSDLQAADIWVDLFLAQGRLIFRGETWKLR